MSDASQVRRLAEMNRSRLVWGVIVLSVLSLLAVLVVRNGRTVHGYLWLDGEPDRTSTEVEVFVGGGCDPEREQIRSITIEETTDAVVVDLMVRAPLGLGAPTCGSYEGMPHSLHLDSPIGDREIRILNPDSTTTQVLPSPFAD